MRGNVSNYDTSKNIMKKINYRYTFIFLSALLFSAGADGQIFLSPGRAGAGFLKIGLPARSEALGRSYVGLADDISAICYNPAGLAQVKEAGFQFSNLSWLEGSSANNISFVNPSKPGVLGFDFRIFQADDYEMTFTGGSVVEGEKITMRDMLFSASYALNLIKEKPAKKKSVPRYGYTLNDTAARKKLCIGFTAKFISEQLYTKQYTTFAGDFGIIYSGSDPADLYGFSIQNLGPNIGEDPLPLTLRFGNSHKSDNQIITWELCQAIDSAFRACAGFEFSLTDAFMLRFGGYYQNRLGYSAGLGIHTSALSIDYAYVPEITGGLDQTQNFTLRMSF
jgi:hypothetical protein